MPIKVLLWQGPSSSDDLKKPPSYSPPVKRLLALVVVLIAATLAASALFVLRQRELEKQKSQPGLEMHSIPWSELIHSVDLEHDLQDVASKTRPTPRGAPPPPHRSPAPSPPPPPPPPGSPPPPPPGSPPPSWVVESLLPPRPVDDSARYNDSTDTYLVRDARPGTVLLGGHALAGPYSCLAGATILLLSVCHCQPSIYGVVLNQMTNETMGDTAFCPRARDKYPNFVNSTVRFGGPMAPHWTVLGRASSPGAREVVPGLFAGGSLLDLNRQVDKGQTSSGSVGFYAGYVAWRLADLNKQIDKGHWLLAKAPASRLLKTPSASDGSQFTASLMAALK